MTQIQPLRRTGLYCRLSKDDDVQGDSESIKTQKAMLSQYAAEHGFLTVDTYVDDGYSGLNFERPDFLRMLSDIEDGKLDIVITKDLSRLGRDHLKVGFYTEIFFPTKRVRYIAVNDGVDTNNSNNDIAALKNVMNEFYSRDNSRKIRSSIKARAKAGLYRTAFNPLGYRKDPTNKNHLIIDEETAPTIRKIFELSAQGWGAHKIRTHFEKTQVPTPSWWLHQRGEKDYSKRFENPQNKYMWSHTVISNIIKNRLYLGHTVMCKTETLFKVGLSVRTPEEKRIVVESTHEPLVSQEIFDLANEKILSRKREDNSGNISIFSGLIKCGTCGKAMSQRYWTKSHRHKIFICGTYAGYGTDKCTDHRIFYDDLYNAVLGDIRACAKLTFEDREGAVALISKLKGKANTKQEQTAAVKLKAAEKRLADLNRLVDRLYEDFIGGKVTEANFGRLIAKYQAEQAESEKQITALQNTLKEKSETEQGITAWVDLMSKYADLQELTAEVLNEIVCKIAVHDRRTESGELRQTVDIHYRFVGLLNETDYSAKVLKSGAEQRWEKVNAEKAS
jgi:DNA invertase Pin-like site-specific DNA recombinase